MDNITIHPSLLRALLQQRALSGFFQRERSCQDTISLRDPKEGFKEYDMLFRKAQDLGERIQKGLASDDEIQEVSNQFEQLAQEYDIENEFFFWPNGKK